MEVLTWLLWTIWCWVYEQKNVVHKKLTNLGRLHWNLMFVLLSQVGLATIEPNHSLIVSIICHLHLLPRPSKNVPIILWTVHTQTYLILSLTLRNPCCTVYSKYGYCQLIICMCPILLWAAMITWGLMRGSVHLIDHISAMSKTNLMNREVNI